MNYEGKRKRVFSGTRTAYYKYKDFKKAVVTFDESLQDVGLGMRIPEMEEDSLDDMETDEFPKQQPPKQDKK